MNVNEHQWTIDDWIDWANEWKNYQIWCQHTNTPKHAMLKKEEHLTNWINKREEAK